MLAQETEIYAKTHEKPEEIKNYEVPKKLQKSPREDYLAKQQDFPQEEKFSQKDFLELLHQSKYSAFSKKSSLPT